MNSTAIRDGFIRVSVIVLLLAILGGSVFWFFSARGIWPPVEDEPYSVVFVISPGMNSRTLNFDDNPELDARIDRVIRTYGFAAIVVADGDPASQVNTFDFSMFRPGTADRIIEGGTIEENVARLRHHFTEELRNARNQAPERDLMESISLAARILSSRPADEVREIAVMSPMLSTQGVLNFAYDNAWLYSNATDIIEILQDSRNLPNLENITLSWFQGFDVCGVVQDVIPGLQRENLKSTWRLIVESGNGNFNFVEAPPGRGIYEGLPPVSPVPIRSVVTDVIITPAQADVQRGTRHDFSALVAGHGITAQDVDWHIEGPAHPGTYIAPNGRLVVDENDPRDSIVLIAISTEDRSVSGEATVRLREEPLPPAVVTEVTIFPDDVVVGTIPPYNVFDVNALVLGENNPSQEVTFELLGNSDPNTRIDSSGRIFIGDNETAIIIIIRATSILNPSVYAERPVRVFVDAPPVVEVMFLANSATFVNRTQARASIGEWVDFINSQSSGIFLFGCVANIGTGDFDGVALSTARAQAAKDLFVRDYGLDPSRITIRGLSYENPWNRPNGISGTPSWDETAAATNRKVVIMSADDDFAQRVYNGTWRIG